jgi:hypothetical protein
VRSTARDIAESGSPGTGSARSAQRRGAAGLFNQQQHGDAASDVSASAGYDASPSQSPSPSSGLGRDRDPRDSLPHPPARPNKFSLSAERHQRLLQEQQAQKARDAMAAAEAEDDGDWGDDFLSDEEGDFEENGGTEGASGLGFGSAVKNRVLNLSDAGFDDDNADHSPSRGSGGHDGDFDDDDVDDIASGFDDAVDGSATNASRLSSYAYGWLDSSKQPSSLQFQRASDAGAGVGGSPRHSSRTRRGPLSRGSKFDSNLMLRAFDETKVPLSEGADDGKGPPTLSHVIGIYADPTAVKDDWANDFQLDLQRDALRSARQTSRHPSDIMSPVMSLLLHQAKDRAAALAMEEFYSVTGDEEGTNVDDVDSDSLLLCGKAAVPGRVSVELPAGADGDASILRPHRPDLKPAPAYISPDRLGAEVSYGYDEDDVHPTCRRFLDVCTRHLLAIEDHLQRLRADRSTMYALESAADTVYSFTVDPDVVNLRAGDGLKMDSGVAKDILLWKLEYARLLKDNIGTVGPMLGLARYERETGEIGASFEWLEKARAELESSRTTSSAVDTLRIEIQYEMALARQTLGESESAGLFFGRAVDISLALSKREESSGSPNESEQRGLWWALQCKFMLAESMYEQRRFGQAVQYYLEYAMESFLRMIGLMVPDQPEQQTIGISLMRYCVFAPRRLALCVYNAALCLAEMSVVEMAADVGSMAMRTATALGIEDVRMATVEFCGRIKLVLRAAKCAKTEGEDVDGFGCDEKEIPDTLVFDKREMNMQGVSGTGRTFMADFDMDAEGEDEEDWDTQIAREQDILIQRCSETTAAFGRASESGPDGIASIQLGNCDMKSNESSALEDLGLRRYPGFRRGDAEVSAASASKASAAGMKKPVNANYDTNPTDLTESELRQYLNRLNAAAASMTSQQVSYPKPTEPFQVAALGPKEHEKFLRAFVQSRVNSCSVHVSPSSAGTSSSRLSVPGGGPPLAPRLPSYMSADLSSVEGSQSPDAIGNPLREYKRQLQSVDRLSPKFAIIHYEAVWKILRSPGLGSNKREAVRLLVNSAFDGIPVAKRGNPRAHVFDDNEEIDRLSRTFCLLDTLKLAREVLSPDGKDADWFSRATMLLMMSAATLSPAAKSAVELFYAESRAHCGVSRIVPPEELVSCQQRRREHVQHESQQLTPLELRQSVTDAMHRLYWRTRAGVDYSTSKPDSLERLVHADVAASLYLIGSGLSPVSGAAVDITKDEAVLNLDLLPPGFVDDTRRVSGGELISDLQDIWSNLPEAAAEVRAKVCLALAHHMRIVTRDLSNAERMLFDGLYGLHKATLPENTATWSDGAGIVSHPFLCTRMSRISSLAMVSSPLSGSLLYEYGMITLDRSKYRYGIAALEAAVDARKVRDPHDLASLSSAREVATIALSRYDWRRALSNLYDLRSRVHPKDGRRNIFAHLCSQLHQICLDTGYFDAALVPLRAYSTLLFEEGLRDVMQRFRKRLAKKSRIRRRKRLAASAIPLMFSKSGVRRTAGMSSPMTPFFELPSTPTSRLDSIRRKNNAEAAGAGAQYSGDRRPSALVSASHARVAPKSWSSRAAKLFMRATGRTAARRATTIAVTPSLFESQQQRFKTRASPSPQELAHSELPAGHSGNLSTESLHSDEQFSMSSRAATSNWALTDDDPFDDEREELFAIAKEQANVVDSERFEVEILKAKLAFDRGSLTEADRICWSLLDSDLPAHCSRYYVCEIMARVRLKRREITRCLEIVEQMEREVKQLQRPDKMVRVNSQVNSHFRHSRIPSYKSAGLPGASGLNAEDESTFLPEATFLRLSALYHGGRYSEALTYVSLALRRCPTSHLWYRARLHYVHGKVLFATCSTASAPFDGEQITTATTVAVHSMGVDVELVENAMTAFETASGFFGAAGDEMGMVKSDLKWAYTAIDLLFRRVVMPRETSDGQITSLADSCRLSLKAIVFQDVKEVVHSALSFLSTANHPMLLIDAMASLAEIKCIEGEPSSAWSYWVSEAWKLFSRLLTDPEEYKIVLTPLVPVSTLIRLKNQCGRLVRLVMCCSHSADVEAINQHLGMFEAYVTLQVDIDRRMNLASRKQSSSNGDTDAARDESLDCGERIAKGSGNGASTDKMEHVTPDRSRRERPVSSGPSQTGASASGAPAGAFLHILENEGIALGRQGFTVLVNRPRQQVVNAVKETGAVLIPSNFLNGSNKRRNGVSSIESEGQDMEYIFPFNEKIGLGAMYILDDALFEDGGLDDSDDNVSAPKSSRSQPMSQTHRSKSWRDLQRRTRLERQRRGGDTSKSRTKPLASLVDAVRGFDDGSPKEGNLLGETTAEKVWAHLHRVKTETRRYSQGRISIEELGERNGATLRSWLRCIPRSRKEWTVPDSIGKRLVYILYAHGVLGYYSVDCGSCVSRIEFGGKQWHIDPAQPSAAMLPSTILNSRMSGALPQTRPRAPTDSERKYLYRLVNGWKTRGNAWYKDREMDAVSGLSNCVLCSPRVMPETRLYSARKTQRRHPIILIADLTLQVVPWELFLDHVVIRSLTLLDSIRGLQRDSLQAHSQQPLQEAMVSPTAALNRGIVRFINFTSPRREGGDLERSEEARRQQLAFQALLRLNHLSPRGLIERLELGGFSDPTALNAVARPTGPLTTPLTQSKKTVNVLGMRLEARFGRKNFSRLDFVKVSGLGSASTSDLKEAAMIPVQIQPGDKESIRMELGAYIGVFLFTYADLVDVTESVFGLTRAIPRGILIFTPASKMKIVVRHLEDEELATELQQASGRLGGRIVPDIGASTRVIVDYVSRFSRSKLIPIAMFLGEGLGDVWGIRTRPQALHR